MTKHSSLVAIEQKGEQQKIVPQNASPIVITLADGLPQPASDILLQFIPSLSVTLLNHSSDSTVKVQANNKANANSKADVLPIVAVVDGRGLACPLPLLKTKVALRQVNHGQALYVIATDPNSVADITAFCEQSNIMQQQNSQTQPPINNHAQTFLLHCQLQQKTTCHNVSASTQIDTYFHFIITKTVTAVTKTVTKTDST